MDQRVVVDFENEIKTNHLVARFRDELGFEKEMINI